MVILITFQKFIIFQEFVIYIALWSSTRRPLWITGKSIFQTFHHSSPKLKIEKIKQQYNSIQFSKGDNKIIKVMQLNTTLPNSCNRNNHEDHHRRHQIISLLLLKKSIIEYENNSFDLSQSVQQPLNGKTFTILRNQYQGKIDKTYRRAESNLKIPVKGKCQSQRILKKMKTVEQNKRQLLRGNSQKINSNPMLSLQQQEKSIVKKFIPADSKAKQSKRIFRKTQTVSYQGEHNLLTYNESGEDRMRIFMDKYKNRHKTQRNKISASDNQYRQIQNILNRMQSQTQQFKPEMTNSIDCQIKSGFNPQSVKINKNATENKAKIRSIAEVKLQLKARVQLQKQLQNQKILKDRYQILQRIGRGLSGQVFKGKDILSERFVAIKILTNNAINQEHQFYKKIQHQNIVSYYNGFVEKDKRYLILEYFPHTLGKIARQRKFQQHQIKKIFKNIANGLLFLHGISIAHRDIKLDNIVISEDLTVVKFIDFGLCLDINQSENQWSTDFCGTVHYMPPQILSKKEYAPKKTDIWSLGILLYKLVFQRYPYRGKDERQILQKICHTKLVFPQTCNEDLIHIISGMLKRTPNHRFSILEVVQHKWLQ